MAGRLGGINFLLGRSSAVGVNVDAALVCRGEDDLGGDTDNSGVDAEGTVKALSDIMNDLRGSGRKGSISCYNIQSALK